MSPVQLPALEGFSAGVDASQPTRGRPRVQAIKSFGIAKKQNTMNTLAKWNPFQTDYSPFRELEEIESRLETLFERTPFASRRARGDTLLARSWIPSVDLTEDEKEYTVKADLPDVAKADIKVFVREGILEISGERKLEQEQVGKRFHRSERCHGMFQRAFTLPQGAEAEKAKAEFHHGVLTVRVPKNEKAIVKPVEVKVT